MRILCVHMRIVKSAATMVYVLRLFGFLHFMKDYPFRTRLPCEQNRVGMNVEYLQKSQ